MFRDKKMQIWKGSAKYVIELAREGCGPERGGCEWLYLESLLKPLVGLLLFTNNLMGWI